jgi:predicted transcriptional regulator
MNPPVKGKKVHLNLSAKLLAQLDCLADYHFMKRSVLIRLALSEFVHQPINQARLGILDEPLEPGRDVELEEFLKDFYKTHPQYKQE